MIGPQAFKESSINKYNPISPNEVESGPTKTIQQAHMTTQHLTASSTTRPSQIHSTAQLSSARYSLSASPPSVQLCKRFCCHPRRWQRDPHSPLLTSLVDQSRLANSPISLSPFLILIIPSLPLKPSNPSVFLLRLTLLLPTEDPSSPSLLGLLNFPPQTMRLSRQSSLRFSFSFFSSVLTSNVLVWLLRKCGFNLIFQFRSFGLFCFYFYSLDIV